MIDTKKETLVKLAKLIFPGDSDPSLQTRVRWVLHGVVSADGERRIKLEGLKVGASWYSTQEAVDRLIEAVNSPTATIPKATPGQRAAQNDAAKRVLEMAGV